MNCVVCHNNKKYKCSKCRDPYCSITCYQEHQKVCQGTPPIAIEVEQTKIDDEPIVKTDYLSDEELRIPMSKLEKLGKD